MKKTRKHRYQIQNFNQVDFKQLAFDRFRSQADDPPVSLGAHVLNGKFGEGVVTSFGGRGSHAQVEVRFDQTGGKWLVWAFANLQAP